MEAGGRCAASVGSTRAKEATLKTSHCFMYKRHYSMSCSEDEKTGIYVLNYATQVKTIKKNCFIRS